jgi:hypothetical protein
VAIIDTVSPICSSGWSASVLAAIGTAGLAC